MGNQISNSSLRQQIWQEQLLTESTHELYFATRGLISSKKEGGNGIILRKDDFTKKPGNKLTMGLAMNLTGEGVNGDNEMKGNEEEYDTYTFDLYIDQKRNSIRQKGRMDEKKVAYNMRTTAKNLLKKWQARMMEKDIFRKLSGQTSYTFANTPTAASSNRVLFGGDASSQSDIDSSDKFDTSLISKAKVLAKTEVSGRPIIEPLDIEGGRYYVCFVHEYQGYDLKQDSVWMQAQREAGLRGRKNPIFQDAYGVWDGVLVVPHAFVATYTDWGSGGITPGARALFCGKQACAFGIGEPVRWNEESDDRGNKHVITCGAIWGSQKIVFNSEDFGVISLDTYAVNPNA